MAYSWSLLTCCGCIITLCIHQHRDEHDSKSLPAQYETTTNLQLLSCLLRTPRPFWVLLSLCIRVLGHHGMSFDEYHILPY